MKATIFTSEKLKEIYLKKLLDEFWFSPSDAFLRAPEVAIWQSIKTTSPVLDIGCGDGRIDSFLFKKYTIEVGLDPDPREVEKAIKSGLYKNVVTAKAEDMPFKNNTFETVVSNSTFEHIKSDVDAISESSRVLKKGGAFIFTTTSDRLLKSLKRIGLKGEKLKKFNKRVDHYHYRSIDQWKNILEENNLKIIDYNFYFPEDLVRIWYKLFALSTFKPYKRELWSYLKDSKYSKLFPNKMISSVYFALLKGKYNHAFDEGGCWLYISAKKK